MSMNLMEVLTLLNVIFLALTYLDNHRKEKQANSYANKRIAYRKTVKAISGYTTIL